jgi:heptosyltransferase II
MLAKHKILIIGPAWVGDMVMAQTLFKVLKINYPDAQIDVLAPAWSLPLLARMPQVAKGIAMPVGHGQLELKQRYILAKSLRSEAYDQAIVLPNSFKSALIPYWAKIPLRTGWRGEMRYILLNDMRILDKHKYPLMIDRFIALAAAPNTALMGNYPLPELFFSSETQNVALQKHNVSMTKRVLAICPGAEFGPSKRWPEQYYAEVAAVKLADGWDVWILGSPKDSVVAANIMQLTQGQCIDLTGRTSLVEAIDLLSLATAVITNDSGLMHIAAAVNKPLVAVYGSTSTTFTPPLHKLAKVVQLDLECQPCFQRECPLKHHNCMQELRPHQVLQALSGFS